MPLGEIIVFASITLYSIGVVCFRLDPRLAIAVALTVFIAATITMVLGMMDLAQELAVYTFYLLVAGVVLLLIHHIREGSKGSK